MQLEAAFRRSLYLSLAIASLALCFAESEYIPETPVVGVLVGTLLLVAYFLCKSSPKIGPSCIFKFFLITSPLIKFEG